MGEGYFDAVENSYKATAHRVISTQRYLRKTLETLFFSVISVAKNISARDLFDEISNFVHRPRNGRCAFHLDNMSLRESFVRRRGDFLFC